MSHTGVHATHCCARHGCKYGDDCPVVLGQVEQQYPCEQCDDDEIRLNGAMRKAVELGVMEDTQDNRRKLLDILDAAGSAESEDYWGL